MHLIISLIKLHFKTAKICYFLEKMGNFSLFSYLEQNHSSVLLGHFLGNVKELSSKIFGIKVTEVK